MESTAWYFHDGFTTTYTSIAYAIHAAVFDNTACNCRLILDGTSILENETKMV
jgi:hypothetical protein